MNIPDEPGNGYFSFLGKGYMNGTEIKGGGFLGVILGYPLEYFFTDIGSKIIICLLIFVFLMLVTGTTILTLFRTAWKPVQKTKESLESAMIATVQKRKHPIDVDLGDGYLDEDNAFLPSPQEKRKKKNNKDKGGEESDETDILFSSTRFFPLKMRRLLKSRKNWLRWRRLLPI